MLGIFKPAGVLSQGGIKDVPALPDLIDAYRRRAEGKPGAAYVGLVHRLDRNVSGAMVLAKTSKAASRLSDMFRRRDDDLRKTYVAWVHGGPRADHAPLEHQLVRGDRLTRVARAGDRTAKTARLRYSVEARTATTSRLRITLETGLPHQIRAQLAAEGYPILGDVKYGGPSTRIGDGQGARIALHAVELQFAHPVRKGEIVVVAAPVPAELAALL